MTTSQDQRFSLAQPMMLSWSSIKISLTFIKFVMTITLSLFNRSKECVELKFQITLVQTSKDSLVSKFGKSKAMKI